MSKAKIVDVLVSKGYVNKHYCVIFDRELTFSYQEVSPNFFRAEDSGVYQALQYVKGSTNAFGGREFEIELLNGSKRKCKGDHWDTSCNIDHTTSVGISTMEELSECYVFCSGAMDKNILEEWLRNNTPKDYWFYNKYPDFATVLDVRKRWKEDNSFFHYAETTNNIDRTHSLIKIEKELETKSDNIEYKNNSIRKQNKIIIQLLEHIKEVEDIKTEDLADIFNEEFDVYDYLSYEDCIFYKEE